VLITGADLVSDAEFQELKRSLREWCDHESLIGCRLAAEPAGPVRADCRAALFVTAPAEREPELRASLAPFADIRLFSANLARPAELRRDLERAAAERCDLYLTELKAAAVELVAAHAERRGVELAFVRNCPVSLAGERDLDEELVALAEEARAGARDTVAAPARER
jgi:cyclic 2,3-diphosphoglycerate synthetase